MPSAPSALLHRAVGERYNVGFALCARPAEFEKIEALEREHLDAGRRQKLLQASIHDVAIGRSDGDALGADLAQAVDDGLAHCADRQAGPLPQFLEQPRVRLRRRDRRSARYRRP